MPFNLRIIALLGVLALAGTAQSEQHRHITFACQEPIDAPSFEILTVLYQYVFSLQGYTFEMISTPYKRGVHKVITGSLDGACGISRELYDSINSPTIILSNSALARITISASYANDRPAISSLKGLNNPSLRVGATAWSTSNLLLAKDNIAFIPIASVDQAARMLIAGRLDYVVSSQFVISRVLAEINTRKKLIHSTSLYEVNMYPLLHARHKNRLKKFDQTLSKILYCVGSPISANTMELWRKVILDQGVNKHCPT